MHGLENRGLHLMARLERDFQSDFLAELRSKIPREAKVFKNDAIQGYPDVSVHYRGRYILLEFKRKKGEKEQPNQRFYIEEALQHTYATFVYPENRKEVLNAIQHTLASME